MYYWPVADLVSSLGTCHFVSIVGPTGMIDGYAGGNARVSPVMVATLSFSTDIALPRCGTGAKKDMPNLACSQAQGEPPFHDFGSTPRPIATTTA